MIELEKYKFVTSQLLLCIMTLSYAESLLVDCKKSIAICTVARFNCNL